MLGTICKRSWRAWVYNAEHAPQPHTSTSHLRHDTMTMPAFFPRSLSTLSLPLAGARDGNDVQIRRIVTDSRVPLGEGDLFVGLSGPRFDGADHALRALAGGASAIVVPRSHPSAIASLPEGKGRIVVDDTLAALQRLAAAARAAFPGTVVAITGSNGKTTVKDMLRAALGDAVRVSSSPMSWNSQVGVALALLAMDPQADVALIECGISRPGEMVKLAAMVRPDIGVFVNVGEAHRETLLDAATTAREKATLFQSSGAAIPVFVPAHERLAVDALTRVGASVRRVGARDGWTWSDDGCVLEHGERRFAVAHVPAGLRHDVELSVAVALHLVEDTEAVARGIAAWQAAPMRLEMTMTPQGVFVINDAYSADIDSFDVALRTLMSGRGEGRTVAVVGSLAQLGRGTAAAHKRVGEAVAHAGVQTLIVVGEAASDMADAAIRAGMPADAVLRATDVQAAAVELEQRVQRGDRVLVKASRPERLERVVELLFTAFGPAVAHIDLGVVVDNLDTLRRIVGPGVAVMPVVKSFGYGLDSIRLGRLFIQHGADALCVAYADEGTLLRERGITVPILVQNPLPHELDKIVLHGLSSEVSDVASVEALARCASSHGRVANVHVKVDTGMGRSGMSPPQALDTVAACLATPFVHIEGLMTHLASSDDADGDAYTRWQLTQFAEFVAKAKALGASPRWVHAANTAGATRFPDGRFSMVRSGIGLLGYAELPEASPYAPAVRLTTRVVAAKWLEAGQCVGYGATWRVPEGERRRIAVVAIGYNDGYPRHLSNKGWMAVSGVGCPVVGKVCMDVTMLDVTALDETVQPGDEVVVYGTRPGEPSLMEMAARADTISYELLTRISARVRRIFVGEISGQTIAG